MVPIHLITFYAAFKKGLYFFFFRICSSYLPFKEMLTPQASSWHLCRKGELAWPLLYLNFALIFLFDSLPFFYTRGIKLIYLFTTVLTSSGIRSPRFTGCFCYWLAAGSWTSCFPLLASVSSPQSEDNNTSLWLWKLLH